MNSSTIKTGPLAGTPTGTWVIDPAHTSVSFSVRHLMSRVRGRFSEVEGHVVVAEDPPSCSAEALIATASVDTGTRMRDDDLRSSNFFDSAAFPSMRFFSAEVTENDDGLVLVGHLTIRDVTQRVDISVEFLGLDETGLQGEPRIGFSGRATVRRSDFGVGQAGVEGSKVVVGDDVTVELDVEAYLQPSQDRDPTRAPTPRRPPTERTDMTAPCPVEGSAPDPALDAARSEVEPS